MCDPLTGILAAVGAASSLFGGRGSTPTPPPPKPPAILPPPARKPGAEVRVGDGASATTATSTPDFNDFTNKRATATPLGGLGRGGLGL